MKNHEWRDGRASLADFKHIRQAKIGHMIGQSY
jgi:hypothetical protein